MHRTAALALFAFVLGGCRALPGAETPSIAVTRLFGPVVSADVIAGEQEDGTDILLLTGRSDLVRIDLAHRRSTRTAIQLPPPGLEQCWGLARLRDASLWTLMGRNTILQVDADGSVLGQTALADAHVGLFGDDDRLLLQRADFAPPSSALEAMHPYGGERVAWSGIRTRPFPDLARAAVAALNMISCGVSHGREKPCWFPDQAAILLVGVAGQTRRVDLSGLAVVSPEALLAADNPARPVRDAYVDRSDVIWILSSGAPPGGKGDGPGGWILAAYASDGTPRGFGRLSEPARVILRAENGLVTLLSGKGDVVEALLW